MKLTRIALENILATELALNQHFLIFSIKHFLPLQKKAATMNLLFGIALNLETSLCGKVFDK